MGRDLSRARSTTRMPRSIAGRPSQAAPGRQRAVKPAKRDQVVSEGERARLASQGRHARITRRRAQLRRAPIARFRTPNPNYSRPTPLLDTSNQKGAAPPANDHRRNGGKHARRPPELAKARRRFWKRWRGKKGRGGAPSHPRCVREHGEDGGTPQRR